MFSASIGDNSKGKVPCYKSKTKEIRLYALNTQSIQAPSDHTITSISYILSSQGIDEQAEISSSVGEIQPQTIGGKTINWVGKADNITFTVGEKNNLHPEGIADGSGQFDFTKIIIKTDNETGLSSTIIMSLSDIDNHKEYYTLSGMRVTNPSNGIYVCKEGDGYYKVYVH